MAPKRKSLAADSDEEEQSLATSSKPNSKAPKKTKVDPEEETATKPPTAKKPKYPNPQDSTPESDHDVLVQTSPDGSKFIELGKTKRVTVREFKGSTFIDIREFYVEKGSGDMKPGKKGISLTVDQWQQLKECSDDIDELVKEM